jgi:glutamyl-tRNA reductase
MGSITGRSVLVLGAGEMGESMAASLAAAGAANVHVANRTWDRAVEVAARVGGEPVHLDHLPTALDDVDVLLTSTGSSSVLLSAAELAPVMSARATRPLLIVDIAVPRDVDPAAATIDGVTLLDMDDLRTFAELGIAERRREIASVEAILSDELERYLGATSAREVAPLIVAMRDAAEALRAAELERHRARLAGLDDRQLAAVDAVTKGIVAKLLHDPTVALKDAAGTAKGDRLVAALRELFDLEG